MNLLHLSSAAITDNFFFTMFSSLGKLDCKQVAYIPYSEKQFANQALSRMKEYSQNENYKMILAPIKKETDKVFYFKKIHKYTVCLEKLNTLADVSLIHAHSLYTDGGVAYSLHIKYGIPYVVAVRSTDTKCFMKYFLHLRKFGRKILEEASAIVFITPELKKETVHNLFPEGKLPSSVENKSHIIPNGIDSFWLSNVYDTKRDINNKKYNLIQVSRLKPNKNIDKTILALKLLRDKGMDVSLRIVGEGTDKERLENIVKKYGLDSFVSFCGYIKDKRELCNLYRDSDIFVMPSKSETMGISYIEAMTQGLPIVGLNGSGLCGCFDNDPVGSFAVNDRPLSVANSIREVVDNYPEYSTNSIFQSKKFDWEIIISEYNNLYSKILANQNH